MTSHVPRPTRWADSRVTRRWRLATARARCRRTSARSSRTARKTWRASCQGSRANTAPKCDLVTPTSDLVTPSCDLVTPGCYLVTPMRDLVTLPTQLWRSSFPVEKQWMRRYLLTYSIGLLKSNHWYSMFSCKLSGTNPSHTRVIWSMETTNETRDNIGRSDCIKHCPHYEYCNLGYMRPFSNYVISCYKSFTFTHSFAGH